MPMNDSIVLVICLVLLAFVVLWYINRQRVLYRERVFKNRDTVIYNLRRLARAGYIPVSIGKIKFVGEKLVEIASLEKQLDYPDYPSLGYANRNKIIQNLCECIDIYVNAGVPYDFIFQMSD